MLEGVGEKPFFVCVSLRAPALVHTINNNNKKIFKAMLLYEGVIPLSPVSLPQAGAGGVAGDVTLPLLLQAGANSCVTSCPIVSLAVCWPSSWCARLIRGTSLIRGRQLG